MIEYLDQLQNIINSSDLFQYIELAKDMLTQAFPWWDLAGYFEFL